jgi:hypothetical protein
MHCTARLLNVWPFAFQPRRLKGICIKNPDNSAVLDVIGEPLWGQAGVRGAGSGSRRTFRACDSRAYRAALARRHLFPASPESLDLALFFRCTGIMEVRVVIEILGLGEENKAAEEPYLLFPSFRCASRRPFFHSTACPGLSLFRYSQVTDVRMPLPLSCSFSPLPPHHPPSAIHHPPPPSTIHQSPTPSPTRSIYQTLLGSLCPCLLL